MSSVSTRPIRVGEIQSSVLGMAIEAWNDAGQPVFGEQGNLVCVKPFPNMPCASRWGFTFEDMRRCAAAVGAMLNVAPATDQAIVAFVGDEDGSRLRSTYFETFKRPVWDQADWVSIDGRTGGMVIYGRADGVLCVTASV